MVAVNETHGNSLGPAMPKLELVQADMLYTNSRISENISKPDNL